MVEIEFSKPRGKEPKPNQNIDIEDFISIKGIKALGNQLVTEKVKNINTLESLPYDAPEINTIEDKDVDDRNGLGPKNSDENENKDSASNDTAQPTLF